MASPAQAPGFNPDNNPWMRPGAQPQAPTYYEQPVHQYQMPPAPQYNYGPQQPTGYPMPPQVDRQADRKKSKWLIPTSIIAAGAAAVAGVGIYLASSSESGPRTETTSANGMNPGHEGIDTVSADPSTMSSEAFMNSLTRVQQMDYAGVKLNESMQEGADLVRKDLEASGWGDYNLFDRPLVAPAADNTPQQIWDQITASFQYVRHLAQNGEIEEAKKLAAAVAEGTEYDELVGSLANGGGTYNEVGIGHSDSQKPVITDGSYEGVESNGLGLTEFTVEPTATKNYKTFNVVVRLTKGNDDDSQRWVLVKSVN